MPLDFTGESYNKKFVRKNSELPIEESKQSVQKPAVIFNVVDPKYTIDDLILSEETKEAILDAISVYRFQGKIMDTWGLKEKYQDRVSLNINLYGDSGTGKTMAAHAIASAIGKKVIFVDYAEIESKYVGETSKNIKRLFQEAKDADAIIIFDEADALLSKRVTDMRSSTDVSVNQTRSVLLNILNEYPGVVIFTTNFIQNFDSAFIRRIRYQIKFELPNEELRFKLWNMYIPDIMPVEGDLVKLAKEYDEISGSDISNAVFNAAISAARRGGDTVLVEDFEKAIEKIIQAKLDNKGAKETITRRVVSEDYVKKELGINN